MDEFPATIIWSFQAQTLHGLTSWCNNNGI